jgi:hypothetical protein
MRPAQTVVAKAAKKLCKNTETSKPIALQKAAA